MQELQHSEKDVLLGILDATDVSLACEKMRLTYLEFQTPTSGPTGTRAKTPTPNFSCNDRQLRAGTSLFFSRLERC